MVSELSLRQGELSHGELLNLAAVDDRLFNKTFFPRAFRSPDPSFASIVDDALESHARFVNLLMFRDSSKTTRVRAKMGKRIAYGTSKVILYVGASFGKAEQSVGWLKRQIERQTPWAKFYGLRSGTKWTEGEIHVINDLFGTETWVLAYGLLGKHRGINLDDYRPDFIVVDDIVDEEVAASEEQREKAENLVLGSLLDSLTPEAENPQAKMVMTQTPLNRLDPAWKAKDDPMWHTIRIGCWTPETENLPVDYQMSIWEERYPTLDLRARKIAAIARNKGSLFAREKEVKLVSPETSMFISSWLNFWSETTTLPQRMWITGGIDPVPPPSEKAVAQGMVGRDFEVLALVGYAHPNYYLLHYVKNRGHDPSWTIHQFFTMLNMWRVKQFDVEAVAYQATLSWLLSQEMAKRRKYCVINPVKDKRKKYDRINDSLAGIASEGRLYVHPSHTDFISQFNDYPNVEHDDVLDAVSRAVEGSLTIELGEDDWHEIGVTDPDQKPLQLIRGSP